MESAHNRVLRTAIEIWKIQPITGFGLKSFRLKCVEILKRDNLEPRGSMNFSKIDQATLDLRLAQHVSYFNPIKFRFFECFMKCF